MKTPAQGVEAVSQMTRPQEHHLEDFRKMSV